MKEREFTMLSFLSKEVSYTGAKKIMNYQHSIAPTTASCKTRISIIFLNINNLIPRADIRKKQLIVILVASQVGRCERYHRRISTDRGINKD